MIDFKIHTELKSVYKEMDRSVFHYSFDTSFSNILARQDHSEFCMVSFKGDISGYFPVLIRNSKLITTLKFLFVPVSADGEYLSGDQEQIVLEGFVEFLKKDGKVDRILQPLNWVLFQACPSNSISAPFGTYRLELSDEETIWKGLHSKHRNVIRNAQKKEVRILEGMDQLDTFYSLYKQTMERSDMFFEPKGFFEELAKTYQKNVVCAVAYSGDEPQGALFVPYTTQRADYVYGASAGRVSLTGAINALHYQVILELMKKGVRQYDFVGARLSDVKGTKLEGIQKFKQRFGGELVKGYLWKMDINAGKCRMYDMALKTKLGIKGKRIGKDIIDQERLKLG